MTFAFFGRHLRATVFSYGTTATPETWFRRVRDPKLREELLRNHRKWLVSLGKTSLPSVRSFVAALHQGFPWCPRDSPGDMSWLAMSVLVRTNLAFVAQLLGPDTKVLPGGYVEQLKRDLLQTTPD